MTFKPFAHEGKLKHRTCIYGSQELFLVRSLMEVRRRNGSVSLYVSYFDRAGRMCSVTIPQGKLPNLKPSGKSLSEAEIAALVNQHREDLNSCMEDDELSDRERTLFEGWGNWLIDDLPEILEANGIDRSRLPLVLGKEDA